MLSKSQYTRYLQCPKLFWLYRKDRNKLTPPSFHQQQIFAMGTKVGLIAQELFPGGTGIPFSPDGIEGMAIRTENLIAGGGTTIYEASFIYDDIFAAVDILRFSEGKWHLYEVKSSTGVKDYYLDDAAIQYYILENSGLEMGTVNIVHIDKGYVRSEELDIEALFAVKDITEEVLTRQAGIGERIGDMNGVLCGGEPDIPIGPHCISPFECSAYDYCWKELARIPEESVFTLNRAPLEEKFELYHRGIVNVSDVPPEGRPLMQQLQIGGNVSIDRDAIVSFVSSLARPVSHLDFESFQQPVPEYPGTKPFSQIPFQYSLHTEKENGLEHREFLGKTGEDPRRALAERLIMDVPPKGTVLAYNMGFEKSIIGSLAATFPDLAVALKAIAGRIDDLMIPFKQGWYYAPAMNGSYSIKKVLPALVPEMEKAYEELPVVHNGGEASAIWESLGDMRDEGKVENIRKGLLEYCRLDTLAMVKVLEKLREI